MGQSKETFIHLANHTPVTAGALSTSEDYAFSSTVLGISTLGITDTEIRSWIAWEQACLRHERRPLFGWKTTYTFPLDQRKQRVALFAQTQSGLESIHLLSTQARNKKSGLEYSDIEACTEGIIAIADPFSLESMTHVFGSGQLFLGIQYFGDLQSESRLRQGLQLEQKYRVPLIAFNSVWRTSYRDYDVALSQIVRAHRLKKPFKKECAKEPLTTFAQNPLAYEFFLKKAKEDEHNVLAPLHPEGWLKPEVMMTKLYEIAPQVAERTAVLAENIEHLELPRPILPDVPLPEGQTPSSYLTKRAEAGFSDRYPNGNLQARTQLSQEIDLIHEKQLENMFIVALMVCDLAQEHGIALNGMGSATGSVLNYCLGITPVDPIANGLSFDRFLNKTTTKKPDTDFNIERNEHGHFIDLVLGWAQSMGISAARISTFSKFGLDGAVRSVLKVFSFSEDEVRKIQKARKRKAEIPDFPGRSTIGILADKLAARGIETGENGTHGSKIIFIDPNTPNILTYHHDRKKRPVADITKDDAEQYANLDFVATSGLDLIKLIKSKLKDRFRIENNHAETLQEIFHGRSPGVPFLETPWLRTKLVEYGKAKNYKGLTEQDLTIVFAFSRPAPQLLYPEYLRRVSGEVPVQYAHPILEEILGETLGIIVFQEQALEVAQQIGGFTDEEREQLRKAISKQRGIIAISQYEARFLQNAQRLNVPKEDAQELFNQIKRFVQYGFLKGHVLSEMSSIAYTIAYLKQLFPQEVFEAIFELQRNHYILYGYPEVYVNEAKRLKLDLSQMQI